MARFLACSWRCFGGGGRLCNRDSTPQCIAWLVVGHAFCLGDDRTDVHGRNAFSPAVAPPLLVPGLGASVVTTLCQQRRPPVLRVLQFNIRAAISGAGGVHVSQIAAEIEAVQPDLVSLNEVDSHTLTFRDGRPADRSGAAGWWSWTGGPRSAAPCQESPGLTGQEAD